MDHVDPRGYLHSTTEDHILLLIHSQFRGRIYFLEQLGVELVLYTVLHALWWIVVVKLTNFLHSFMHRVQSWIQLETVGDIRQHICLHPHVNPCEADDAFIILYFILPKGREVVTIFFSGVINLYKPESIPIKEVIMIGLCECNWLRLDCTHITAVLVVMLPFLWIS